MDDVVHVEVAWETDPLTRPTAPDWTRLGSVDAELLIETLSTTRGVNIRTGDIETGTATAKVADPNGNLDPSNVLGEWAPNVLPRRRIRFVIDPSGADPEVVIWTGFLNALPIQWRTDVQWTTLTAAGIFWLLADEPLPPSVLHVETMALTPEAYWPFAEEVGDTVEDVAGVSTGTLTKAAVGSEDIVPYARGGKTLNASTMRATVIPTADDFALSIWFRATAAATLWEHADTDTGAYIRLGVTSAGVTFAADDGSTSDSDGVAHADLLDGQTHHIAITTSIVSSLFLGVYVWVDGQPMVVDLGGGSISSGAVLGVDGEATMAAVRSMVVGDAAAEVTVGHVAWWNSLEASVATLRDAGVEAWSGDLTGARLERILDVVGVDADDRDIAAGTQTCGPTMLDGANVLTYIRAIAATEGGPVGEDAEGRIFLRDRIVNVPTVVATFSDDPTGDSGYPVAPLDPDFSLDRVVNIARVTRENGTTQEVEATASRTTYGPKSLELNTLHQSPAGSRATAARITNRYADPVLVFPAVTADSIDTTTTVMTGTDIGEAVDVIGRPPRGGDPIEQTSIVERVEHNLAGAESWVTTFGVAEHVTLPTFKWDTAGRGWDQSVWA